ncbi:hypothetical protein RchiOBHm_Chr2g0103311 [Rosa chinensis]|uniref:Uncharacterized protein n=1 Tax=Rosa chinensis TaxID=74649 RepID=A0A2P6RMW2_ROSCH|nr:hypothetical protein RchiOBHm_Chr2g0103311 [Rosa chinensis]
MAFIISKAHQQPSFSSESDLQKQNHSKDGDDQVRSDSITSQLYLKSSSNSKAAAALDRDVVLRRIRHYKNLRKVKTAFQALMGSSELQEATSTKTGIASWLDQEDSFSSP